VSDIELDLKALHLQHTDLVLGEPGAIDLCDAGMNDDYDPEFLPYANFDREKLAGLLDQAHRARDVRKWGMLREFLYDKMTKAELQTDCLATAIWCKVIEECGIPPGDAVVAICGAICDLAALAVRGARVSEGT
jgi:hypothetical protein